jgi:hypothetical protein
MRETSLFLRFWANASSEAHLRTHKHGGSCGSQRIPKPGPFGERPKRLHGLGLSAQRLPKGRPRRRASENGEEPKAVRGALVEGAVNVVLGDRKRRLSRTVFLAPLGVERVAAAVAAKAREISVGAPFLAKTAPRASL